MLVRRLQPLCRWKPLRGYLAGSGWRPPGLGLPLRRCHCRPGCATPRAAGTDLHAGDQGRGRRARREHHLPGACARSSARTRPAVRDVSIPPPLPPSRRRRTIIIATPEFEFGLDEAGTLTLDGRVLTPDSSRFWPLETYADALRGPQPAELRQTVRPRLAGAGDRGRPAMEQSGPRPRACRRTMIAERRRVTATR